MHIDPPADLQAWFDAHQADVFKAVPTLRTFDGDDESRVALMQKLAGDAGLQARYEAELMAAVKVLKAPDRIAKELATFRDQLHLQWSKYSDHDKTAVTGLVNGFSAKTSNKEVARKVAELVGTGKVSANVASTVVHGLSPLMEGKGIPWYCFICYCIPFVGLVCVAIPSCRGELMSTTNTNAAA